MLFRQVILCIFGWANDCGSKLYITSLHLGKYLRIVYVPFLLYLRGKSASLFIILVVFFLQNTILLIIQLIS